MKNYKWRKKMIKIHPDVMIADTATIDVKDGEIGRGTIISAHASIEGRYVKIGQESWIGEYASIGGGSCYDGEAFLDAGDWMHLGHYAHINTARGVRLGHEVGIGWRSAVFTHGAYESCLDGFPVEWGEVTMGDRVWLPHAWVNPNVHIGNDVVVSAMSLVNRDLPSGCLAGGIPVKVIKENAYPSPLTPTGIKKFRYQISKRVVDLLGSDAGVNFDDNRIIVIYDGSITSFFLEERRIVGNANSATEIVKEQLRRNGVRFRYAWFKGKYVSWEELEKMDWENIN